MHNLFRGTFISVKVRLANLSDAEEIANIYNHEVLSGVATFDLVPKTLDEQREWLRERSGALPCIVALNDSRKVVGQKKAREIFFLGRTYDAEERFVMGDVNAVVDHQDLERVALEWAQEINSKSPTAQRMAKFAFNLTDDGLIGQQVFAGEATRLAYGTDEAVEGRDAFLEKRDQDFGQFPWHF